jgi:hypothetical protein
MSFLKLKSFEILVTILLFWHVSQKKTKLYCQKKIMYYYNALHTRSPQLI